MKNILRFLVLFLPILFLTACEEDNTEEPCAKEYETAPSTDYSDQSAAPFYSFGFEFVDSQTGESYYDWYDPDYFHITCASSDGDTSFLSRRGQEPCDFTFNNFFNFTNGVPIAWGLNEERATTNPDDYRGIVWGTFWFDFEYQEFDLHFSPEQVTRVRIEQTLENEGTCDELRQLFVYWDGELISTSVVTFIFRETPRFGGEEYNVYVDLLDIELDFTGDHTIKF